MYRNIILGTFLVILTSSVMGATVQGEPDLRFVPEDNTFSPGETSRFTFSIMNEGTVDEPGPQNLEAQVMSAEGLTYSVGEDGNSSASIRDDTFAVGSVPDGLFPQKMGFMVAVDDEASAGVYSVPVNLSYRFKDSITYDQSSGAVSDYSYEDEFVEKNLILRVRETANLELVSSSYSGAVGDSGVLTLEVKNSGNASVEDTSFTLNSKNSDLSFGQTGTAEKYIGEWEEGETKTLEFKASVSPNALESEMTVQASSSFSNDGYTESDSFSFGLLAGSENKFSLENVDAELRKGSEGNISGTVVNDAGRDLSSVELVFNPSDPRLTVKQSSYAIGGLENGEEANFSFPVEVSSGTEPGPRIYSLSATYRNPEGERRSTSSVDFDAEIIGSEGDFVVEAINNTVSTGSSDVLTVNVTNPSSSTYENVDAKIFTSDPISSSDDRAFSTQIEPGETEKMSFKVASGSSALSKAYPVRMDFRYEVGDESKFSETYRTAVNVEESDSSGSSALPVAVVVLVLLVCLSYYFGKPEKLWNKLK